MLEVAVATTVLGLLLVVVGLPSAILLRRRADGWLAVLIDAALHGLVWLPLAVTAWAWLELAGLAVVVAAWATVVFLVATGRAKAPPMRRPAVLGRRAITLGGGWLVVLTVAALVRMREDNFLPWIGDMGGYVNWANEFVRTGDLRAQWPPLYPAYLAVSTALFGTAHTTIGMPVVGIILLLGIARMLHQLGVHRGVLLAAGGAVALNLHAVWFSSFPASESLNAPVFVLWLTLVHRLLVGSARHRAVVAGVGVTMLALGLLRGSAPLLLLPLGVVVVLALEIRLWRRFARPLWSAFAVSAVASVVCYWYGIAQIPGYFVGSQLHEMLPGRVWLQLERGGLFDLTVRTAATLVLGGATILLVGTVVVARISRAGPRTAAVGGTSARWVRFVPLVVAALFAALVWSQVLVDGEVAAILSRMSAALVAGAVLTLAAAGWSRARAGQVVAVLMGSVALTFVGLQARRLGGVRTHAFYLYWDRYLFSEVLPVLVVLTFLGLGWVVERLGRTTVPGRHRTRALQVVAAVVVVGIVVVPSLRALRLAAADVYMRGAYDLTDRLANLVAQEDLPVYWSADSNNGVPGFFIFPNTWMAFAVPLERTFGLDVFNIEQGRHHDFERDDVLEARQVPFIAACAQVTEFVLLDVATGGPGADRAVSSPGVRVEPLGVEEGAVSFLTQPPDELGWHVVDFRVAAWRVTVEPSALVSSPPCWLDIGGGSGSSMLAQ